MESQTEIKVYFKSNPAMAEAVRAASLGDEAKGQFIGKYKEITDDFAVIGQVALVPEGFEVDEAADAAPQPMASPVGVGAADETIPTAIASMVSKKG
jgi:hypothetical protein